MYVTKLYLYNVHVPIQNIHVPSELVLVLVLVLEIALVLVLPHVRLSCPPPTDTCKA